MPKSIDYMLGILHDPWQKMHMGITAENVAERYGISAPDAGRAGPAPASSAPPPPWLPATSKSKSSPVEIATRKGAVLFQEDEHVRASTTLEALAGMKPAFKKDSGTVTAGNASGINDGASAVVLAAGDRVAALGLKPLAPPGGLRPRRGGTRLHGHRPRARHAKGAGSAPA